ncbi:hypothetical protein M427DRAFT_56260 [Gonapodya prolifera JEL478]|uniref:Uncharacterized protein n=1 Tax=Gonapodya prolifera (strain JEL478) TaxID=1344416 RepID=A0A139AGZ2_GONPJ|nr:hypothetical protein M427DRAFT_56260 [Gonapodya prolifera JEL478]|eukprot:KXS15959.1 hypothetical protein M427DRAFT_56260 [Gonapodya prolifera JEL478]
MGAAWCAFRKLGGEEKGITYYGGKHGVEPEYDEFKGKNVLLVDFTYPRPITDRIRSLASSLLVLDHHKTAAADFVDAPYAVFNMDMSGATMSWQYFFPQEECPMLLQYIEDGDLWKWKLERSKEFYAFWQSVPLTFDTYTRFSDPTNLSSALTAGSAIMTYSQFQIGQLAERCFKRRLCGVTAGCINSRAWISELGNKVVERDGIDVALVFYYDGGDDDTKEAKEAGKEEKGEQEKKKKEGIWKCSLRSLDSKADASAIAKKFGGGGHRNAAGFVWREPSIETLFDKE